MPLIDSYGRMDLSRIWVDRTARQRSDPDPEKGGLLQSIALRGVICPVILERDAGAGGAPPGFHKLYAGERRLVASRTLGLFDIPYRFASEPDEAEVQIIEFEENNKRNELSWQESVEAVVAIHQILAARDEGWTLAETAASISLDASNVSRYVFVHGYWGEEAITKCGTFNEAYNLLQRRLRRAQANALEAWLGGEASPQSPRSEEEEQSESNIDDTILLGVDNTSNMGNVVESVKTRTNVTSGTRGFAGNPNVPLPSPFEPVLAQDFNVWSEHYSGPKFNLIHCDFPYGINFKIGVNTGPNTLHREEGEMYEDAEATYLELLCNLAKNWDKFTSESCHLLFWYSNRFATEKFTREILSTIPGLKLSRYPLIWLKSDNAGMITPNEPRHIYETCLFGSRGERPVVKYKSDAYSCGTDNTLHVSAKPEPMLRYFMEMVVDEHSRVLDPTCGAGSALRAADSLRAERIMGLELNPEMVRVANRELGLARRKRQAAAGMVGG